MPYYYSVADARSTSATAATQLQVARMSTAANGRQVAISRLVVGAKGAAQDNPTLFQLWRPSTAPSGGTTQAAVAHDPSAPSATCVYATSATSITAGTKGTFPVVQLAFNARAMVQWVALNPDEAITMFANAVAATGHMEIWTEEAAAVAVPLVFTTTWYE